MISREAVINAIEKTKSARTDDNEVYVAKVNLLMKIDALPPIQPEIVRCKDCQYWNKGSCECREHAVNCQDYYVGDIETEAEYFCGYAERREVTE